MAFGQIHYNGSLCAALIDNGKARPVPGVTALELLLNPELAKQAGKALDNWQPFLPIHPPEVWGCGCTYETSASFRDAEHGT